MLYWVCPQAILEKKVKLTAHTLGAPAAGTLVIMCGSCDLGLKLCEVLWSSHAPQQPNEKYYCLRLFVEICGPRQARTRTGMGTIGSIPKASPWYYEHAPVVSGILEVIPPAPYLFPLALVDQMASLPRFLTLSAPARLSPRPGSVVDVPSHRQKGCRQTSADLKDVGKIQVFTHFEPWMCSFSVSCFLRELLDGVIHCGMRV